MLQVAKILTIFALLQGFYFCCNFQQSSQVAERLRVYFQCVNLLQVYRKIASCNGTFKASMETLALDLAPVITRHAVIFGIRNSSSE